MFRGLIGLAASCLLATFNVNAQVVNCNSASSDADGDGWGWENGVSCVVAATQAPSSGFCSSASSDPDGDGWGWENGASCAVSGGSSGGSPGNPAGNVVADLTGSLIGTEADTHYFTLTEATSVSISGLNSYYFGLTLFDASGSLIWQDSYWYADQCLQAGSYTVQIGQPYPNTLDPQYYAVSISDTELGCTTPSSTTNIGDVSYAIITSNGTILSSSYDGGQITAYDRYGARLWQFSDASYFDAAESLPDSSVLLAYTTNDDYQTRIALIENNGNVRWTQTTDDYVYEISANNDVAAISFGNALVAIDLTNGSIKLRYEYPYNQYAAGNPRVMDDGTVVAMTYNQDGSIQLLTFD